MHLTRRTFALGLGALAFTRAIGAEQGPRRAKLHVPRYGPALATNGEIAILSGGAPIGAENQDDHVYSNLLGLVEGIDPRSLKQKFIANAVYPRANHAAVWVDSQLWLLGGRTRIADQPRLAFETERVDLQTQAIWRGPDLPTGLIHLSAVVFDKSIFVFGGIYRSESSGESTVSAQVYECAPPYERWQTRAPMPVALSNCGAVVVGKEIVVVGGYDRTKAHAVTQVFDPGRDSWSAGPPPPIPLSAHAAAAVDGRVYTFGDYTNQSSVLGLAVESGKWRSLQLPFTPRRHVRAVTVGDNVVVAGGNQTSYAPALDAVESFPASVLDSAFGSATQVSPQAEP
ncbi:MAG: hypothetical protein QNJ00_12140 [Woeseiaceae bacterium]|nr:hypothetical protein [Woeseiaceae bacterium]